LLHEQDWIGCGWCGAMLQVEVLKKVPDAGPVSLVLRLLLLWEVVQHDHQDFQEEWLPVQDLEEETLQTCMHCCT
jgi:hypothetical protein